MSGLQRRGPDGLGYYVDENVRMSHARLAIVGLDARGVEPLENHRFVLAFNGEIYNWGSLRDSIVGHVDAPMPTDAHVLLEMWTREGAACLSKLNGFWAFSIYDKTTGAVTLVRDQMGIKPLYWCHDKLGFHASSTLNGLLGVCSPLTRADLDYQALSEYVRYQFTFGNKTFFKAVRKVMPGQVVTFKCLENVTAAVSGIYEDIWARTEDVPATDAWVDETRLLLRECVLESTGSDAGFTTLVSGGLDSGMVTRLARPDIAYHCNYSDPDCNETFFAQQTVEGTCRMLTVNASEEFDLVDRLRSIIEDFDELTIGSVILPLDELLQQVKRRHKVVLTGTGGDELFGGYVRYQLAQGQCLQDSYKGMFERMQGCTTWGQAFEVSHAKGADVYRFYQDARPAFESNEGESPLDFDRRNFLPGLLNIDDKIAGRHGIEARPSLLHQRFVRRMMQVTPDVLPDLKSIGKRIATGILPGFVIHRKDKMGFTTPIGTFVNANADRIREEVQSSPFRDLYDLSKMRWTTEPGAGKFDRKVFGLLMLDLWLQRYCGGLS